MGSRSLFHVVAVPRAFFGTFFRFERKYYPFGAAAPPLAPESVRQAPHSQQTFRSAKRACGHNGGFPSLPALFHSKHVIKLQTCFHTSRNASRPTHKTNQNFLPLFNKKSREPHVFHETPHFYFILARADSAVAHNTVLAPAKPYNDSASHSGRNTPPVRSPDDTCAAAADSSPADAALAGIPPTASA